jgi:hypothetical protein
MDEVGPAAQGRRDVLEALQVVTPATRLATGVLLTLTLVGGAACGSSGSNASTSSVAPSAACAAAMKAFHDGLVASNNNLTDPQRSAFEKGTLNACTRAEWLGGVKAYTGNAITEIVIGKQEPADTLKAFCDDSPKANACQ